MSRQLGQSAIALLLALGISLPAVARQVELALPLPPIARAGHWYVAARPMTEWMGGVVQWQAPDSLIITWRGRTHRWGSGAEPFLRVRQRAYVSLQGLARAFGLRAELREDFPAVAFGDGEIGDLIPVGWRFPRRPNRLTADQRAVWRLLIRPQTRWVVGGMICQPTDIRVVGRWATASVRPLNVCTDDARAVLGKRGGRWHILEISTSVGEGANYGMPGRTRRRLGLL